MILFETPKLWYLYNRENTIKDGLHGSTPVRAFLMPERRCRMSYRKVTYLEQCWYILRFWLREKIRKDDPDAKKTEASVRVPRMPKSDR